MKSELDKIPLAERMIFRSVYPALFFLMAVTGFAQMPIFKRYYLADLPGFGWLAQYYVTHTIHYLGATALLLVISYSSIVYLMLLRKHYRLTLLARVRIVLLAAIVGTGIFRVLKNLPNVLFSPEFTLFIDISHLAFMLVYTLFAIAAMLSGARWLTEKIRVT